MSILERAYRNRHTPLAKFIDAVGFSLAGVMALYAPDQSWWETPVGWISIGIGLSNVGQWLDALHDQWERRQ